MKTCKSCNINKLETEYYKYDLSADKLRYQCKICCKEIQSKRQKLYKESQNEYTKRYLVRKKAGIPSEIKIKKTDEEKRLYRNQYMNEYQKRRVKIDKIYHLRINIGKRLNTACRIKKFKKDTEFAKYLGCTAEELKIHLESKFQLGMTWDNYGPYGWHVDHVIPLGIAETEEELYKLCHYTNLQPLWAIDNLKKGCKVA